MSLLNEILNNLPEKNKSKVIESRAIHSIASAISFVKLIKENYTEEEADYLIKKFIFAIKTEDSKKILKYLK